MRQVRRGAYVRAAGDHFPLVINLAHSLLRHVCFRISDYRARFRVFPGSPRPVFRDFVSNQGHGPGFFSDLKMGLKIWKWCIPI